MNFPTYQLSLPAWIADFLPPAGHVFATVEAQMDLAIALAQRNVAAGSGGPFGAAIFDMDTGRLVAPGVNQVVPSNSSIAHAEIVAITMAQQVLGTFDLGAGGRRLALVTSTEPCAMCFGAVPWSGVRRLVCGARDEDARRIGFDEGPKLADWVSALNERGIEVLRDVRRAAGAAVLQAYRDAGGLI